VTDDVRASVLAPTDPRRARLHALITQFRLEPRAAAALLRSVAEDLQAEVVDDEGSGEEST
jgi:hypothetical protein